MNTHRVLFAHLLGAAILGQCLHHHPPRRRVEPTTYYTPRLTKRQKRRLRGKLKGAL